MALTSHDQRLLLTGRSGELLSTPTTAQGKKCMKCLQTPFGKASCIEIRFDFIVGQEKVPQEVMGVL